MSTTQKEIFRKKYHGYDEKCVDVYIRDLQSKLDSLVVEKDSLETNLIEIKSQFKETSDELAELKNTIENREKAADEISRIALKEANLIVDTANKNADSIVKESLATARQILVEMSNLGNEAIFLKKHVKERMKNLAKVIDEFTLPNIPSLDCLELKDENEDKDTH